MNIRSVYPLKSFPSMKEAQVYARKIKAGTSKHSDSKLEVHWNKKAHKKVSLTAPKSVAGVFTQLPQQSEEEVDDSLQWIVVVVDEDPIPGGVECAECSQTHFEDDYLCPDCRAAL